LESGNAPQRNWNPGWNTNYIQGVKPERFTDSVDNRVKGCTPLAVTLLEYCNASINSIAKEREN
jgi:hypothetical protein